MLTKPRSASTETALRGSTSENLLRLVEAETGALTLLGDSSAIFVRWTGVHENGPLSSTEEASIFVYWWGYEIALPPPAMSALAQARSTQRTILWFLQVYVAAGGTSTRSPSSFVTVLRLNLRTYRCSGACTVRPLHLGVSRLRMAGHQSAGQGYARSHSQGCVASY